MGGILSVCYEPRSRSVSETHIIYAPYCNGCNGRIYQQVTLKEGKYLLFFCSDKCKNEYLESM